MGNIMLERSSNGKGNSESLFEFFDILPYSEESPVERNQRMTIAIGFRCQDSVIVCADREITLGTGKLLKKKIWAANQREQSVIVTGAGAFSHLESAATKIIEKLKHSSLGDAPKIMRSAFEYVCKKEYFHKPGCPPPGSVPFDLIVAASDSKQVRLFRMEQGVLKHGRRAELAGSGAPWAQYFFDQFHHFPRLVDGITLGAYAVYSVKRSGLGCGGPTDLWVLQAGKKPEPVPVKYLDSAFTSLRVPFRDLLFGFSNLGLSDANFNKELRRIEGLLRGYRESYKGKWRRPISRVAHEIPE